MFLIMANKLSISLSRDHNLHHLLLRHGSPLSKAGHPKKLKEPNPEQGKGFPKNISRLKNHQKSIIKTFEKIFCLTCFVKGPKLFINDSMFTFDTTRYKNYTSKRLIWSYTCLAKYSNLVWELPFSDFLLSLELNAWEYISFCFL